MWKQWTQAPVLLCDRISMWPREEWKIAATKKCYVFRGPLWFGINLKETFKTQSLQSLYISHNVTCLWYIMHILEKQGKGKVSLFNLSMHEWICWWWGPCSFCNEWDLMSQQHEWSWLMVYSVFAELLGGPWADAVIMSSKHLTFMFNMNLHLSPCEADRWGQDSVALLPQRKAKMLHELYHSKAARSESHTTQAVNKLLSTATVTPQTT